MKRCGRCHAAFTDDGYENCGPCSDELFDLYQDMRIRNESVADFMQLSLQRIYQQIEAANAPK